LVQKSQVRPKVSFCALSFLSNEHRDARTEFRLILPFGQRYRQTNPRRRSDAGRGPGCLRRWPKGLSIRTQLLGLDWARAEAAFERAIPNCPLLTAAASIVMFADGKW